MGLKADFDILINRNEKGYQSYKEQIANMEREYRDLSSRFDLLIGTINAERLSFRKEIRILYDFLMAMGGSLKEEKKISIFDFVDENPAQSMLCTEIEGTENVDYKGIDGWTVVAGLSFGAIGLTANLINKYNTNKEIYEKFLLEVENKESEYIKDLKSKNNNISSLKDAIEIAKIYRSIIVTVKDTISEKIIPELDFIRSFLYADAIRELVLEGESLETNSIEPCNIAEYKGTKQDIHYQFIKNTFDFYRISTQFFKKTVLTDILEDRVVTEQEKADFNEQVQLIKNQINSLEDMKVVK